MRASIEDHVVHSPYPSAEIPCCSFYDAAKKALLKDPEKPALADGAVMVTRRELFVLMQRYAVGFQKQGLAPGHRVCVHLGNSVDNFIAMWACVFAGASVMLSKTSLTERELRYQLSDSESTHVLTEPAFAEKIAKAAMSLDIKGFFATGPAEGFVSTAAFRDLDEASFREVPIPDPRDCILGICYTSGTTGLPKGVVITHYGFVANMATAGPCFSWDESDVALSATPLMHGSGFLIFTFGVLLGTTIVMESLGASLQRVNELITKYKVTSLTLLPAHLASLVAEMQKTGIRLAGVRRIGTGGSVLTESSRKSLQAVFPDLECVVNGYALTESMGILCSPSIHAASGTDVGFPAPRTQIKVVDIVTRKKLGPNQTGEICFRAPTVFKEYYKKPKESAEVFEEDGWCKSGDAGYYDEDGRLYILHRLKEMIKCMDNQVVPAELEELILKEHSDFISDVVIVGLPSAQHGEAPAAVIVLKDHSGSKCDTENLAKKIKATVADNLAVHKHLYGGVYFIESLPRTDTGKVIRNALADGAVMVTRRELFVLMQRYAVGFQKQGLAPGHRVCVHLGNSVENFIAMWACVFAGASVMLSKTSLTERELRYQLSDSESTHILTEPAFAEKIAKAAMSLDIKGFFATGPAEGFVSTAAFRDLDEASFREVPIPDPRDCILGICYTSGTTDLPKGVVITHYGVVANMVTAGPCFSWDESDVALSAMPLMHSSGILIITFGVLLGTTIAMESLGASLQRVNELITKYKVTSLTLLSAHLASLVAEMQKTGIRLAGVRRIGTGGSMLTESSRKSSQAVFPDLECVVNGYALTESMGFLCSPSIHAAGGTDVGFPAPRTQIKVVDIVTRKKHGPNQTGEICFRAPTVFKEYYKKPKKTAEVFEEDGWCKSGDAGYYDEDGRLYIVQRLKEMIKCMDNQVVPAELEELILEEHSDLISDVVIVGLPSAQHGEAPAAVIVLKDHSGSKCHTENLAKKIKATVADNLAVHKHLYGGVYFFESLPRTDTGKVIRNALADGAVMVTRRELFVLMQRYAVGFQKQGLAPGHRVCVHLGNSVENFIAMWACVFAGASVMLSKTSLSERELRYQLSDSESTHVLTEPAFAEKIAKAAMSLDIKGFFATGPAEGFVSTAAFRDLDEASFREVPIPDPRDCILGICYTSGTTDLPKGVVITHYGFVANMATAGPCFSWDESDVALSATPLMHGSGILIITFGVLLGTTIVMESLGASLQRVNELITKYKVTSLTLLSAHLASLVAEMQKTGNRLAGVRRIGTGGSMLTESSRKSLQAVFPDLECVVNGYALTESMGILCSPSIHAASGTDVGFPAPRTQIKVVDIVTRKKLGPNQTGEICFRAPTVFKEYYKKPKETAEVFEEDGWCKSGDAGYYDEDGRLYIVQRLKELIKCMDNQVVPAELEELILEEHSDLISDVVIVGLPSAQHGEAPAAVIVLKDHSGSKCDTENLAKKIKATVADNLAVHKHLYGGVFFFDSLPKTDTGKVTRSALVQACTSRSAL
ncbi:uncharacterized protein LOC144099417 isoform X2 [Amblyomma americanum]